MDHGLDRGQSLCGCVFQQSGDETNGLWRSLAEDLKVGQQMWAMGLEDGDSADLVKWMGFDLGEFVFHIVGVHSPDLLAGWCAKNFDDFDELVDTRFTGEEGLAQHQLRHDTAS